MSLCAACGLVLSGSAVVCPHHITIYNNEWAVANRVICDFFHRGITPPRLTAQERDDEQWWFTIA